MIRILSGLLVALALVFGLTLQAGAQSDLGNDGIDMDCGDFGGDSAAAQAYFEGDGGSQSRNVDDLDRDGDGGACDNPGGGGGGGNTGDTTDTTDDGTTSGGTTGGSTSGGTTSGGSTSGGTTTGTALPTTGAGITQTSGSSSLTFGLLVAAGVVGAVGFRARRA